MATNRMKAFERSMADYYRMRGARCSRWQGASPRTINLQAIQTPRGLVILYAKDSALQPAFWGLSESRLQSLRDSGAEWAVVLLHGAAEASYVMTPEQVAYAIKTRSWSLSPKNAEWKVHEDAGPEMAGAARHFRFVDLFEAVIGSA